MTPAPANTDAKIGQIVAIALIPRQLPNRVAMNQKANRKTNPEAVTVAARPCRPELRQFGASHCGVCAIVERVDLGHCLVLKRMDCHERVDFQLGDGEFITGGRVF
jgi:hypothetical protein